MVIGDPSAFALEFEIDVAYERSSVKGLGYFAIHLAGLPFGVRERDATLLACSYDGVRTRLAKRGRHVLPVELPRAPEVLADAVGRALYAEEEERSYLGVDRGQFTKALYTTGVLWAPDGDAAFDDGSCVLHMDIGNRARVIGFKRLTDQRHDPNSLRDIWLDAEVFYETLTQWVVAFDAAWLLAPKGKD